MSAFKVFVTDRRHESYEIEKGILQQIDAELIVCDCASPEAIADRCRDADAVLLDMAPMTEKAIAGLDHCKVISRYGVGYDNVDVKAATAAGIRVTNVPDYCMEDVSDHALAMLLSALRHIAKKDSEIRQGNWNIRGTSFRLQGKVLGVVGAGRIGRALIRKVSGFGLNEILVYDPYVSGEELALLGVKQVSMEELLSKSDFVSLHMAATPDTKGMIGQKALSLMKKNAILVNVSRGSLVDDKALLAALQNRQILAAALDTHNQEPLGADSPFCKLDNVTLTDHTAYSTVEGVDELKTKAAQNVVDVLLGREPKYPVN